MMQSEPLTLPIYSGDGVTAVELPYVGGQYVADIIMPTVNPSLNSSPVCHPEPSRASSSSSRPRTAWR